MLYTISNSLTNIDFAPDETAEILQNVKTILTTIKGSAPLFRDFGFDGASLDLPQPIAQAKITAEIAAQVQMYEPRCKVKKCDVTGNLDGTLQIIAQIEVV